MRLDVTETDNSTETSDDTMETDQTSDNTQAEKESKDIYNLELKLA